MRVDDPAAGEARETDVRHRGERQARVAHRRGARAARPSGRRRGSSRSRRRRARRAAAPRLGADAAGDLAVVVEGEQRDDRERRDAAHRLDRDDELVEVEERLDHEQVDAATLEDPRLLRVEGAVLGGVEDLELAERADRARDEDVAAGDLARLPCQPNAGRVDLLELVVEQDAGELAAVGAERVRLDQLGAGRDVARVHRDDALGRAEIRLLGAAQAADGARDERAHPAVGDERRAGSQAVEEAAHGAATLDQRVRRRGGAAAGPRPTRSAPRAGAGPPSREGRR